MTSAPVRPVLKHGQIIARFQGPRGGLVVALKVTTEDAAGRQAFTHLALIISCGVLNRRISRTCYRGRCGGRVNSVEYRRVRQWQRTPGRKVRGGRVSIALRKAREPQQGRKTNILWDCFHARFPATRCELSSLEAVRMQGFSSLRGDPDI